MRFFLQIFFIKISLFWSYLFYMSLFFTTTRYWIRHVPRKADMWHDVTRWQGRWGRGRKWWLARRDHTWWLVRRDHTCWSSWHFLLPYKTLLPPFHLHYEIVEVSSVESDFLLLYVSLLKCFISVKNFAQN